MNRSIRLYRALPVIVLGAALALVPRPGFPSDLCGEDGDWSQTHFGDRGKTATDLQEIHEPAPRGAWRIDCGDNGSAQLSAWDKDEIQICAQVTAWAPDRARAEALRRSIHVETGGGMLRAEGPDQTRTSRWSVSYRIFAPKKLDLNAQAVNGGVSIEGIHGRIVLHSVNGPIGITDSGGDVRGRTTNGPLSVRLAGTRWSGEGLDVETVNGPISLMVPERFSADLETGTTNGPMEMAFPVTMQGRMTHHITTVLGQGGPPIRVVTTNGPVVVERPGRE
ncbi:MAG TPA: hypothetical protein VK123_08625 [Candidatus Limnocylindrales bacterium]|nr:hypothetical protein [Candidatus Limnocylindrales bacterium]